MDDAEAEYEMRKRDAMADEEIECLKNLLAKYMQHVCDSEGTDFVQFRDRGTWTDEEWSTLQEVRPKYPETVKPCGCRPYYNCPEHRIFPEGPSSQRHKDGDSPW